ncbi:non-repetitive nucleoporin [Histoplasma capsulatum H143]|uniref:Non-repetitive nucleoporin n=1 Tax=Ajellomyces capsulatus (strain H143) TaxID=544712 RepID=C6H374_AJECH|nr:non-repetitive nucleoporin [Histoplasma capsulatum H143]
MTAPPLTPQRPLPGTYFQTPAHPNFNGPLFQSSTMSGGGGLPTTAAALPPQPLRARLPMTTVKSRAENLNPRQRAALTIDEALAQESRYPDLDSYLSQGFSSDYDIPTSASWAPFQKVKMYNIPDQIFDQYNRAQVSTNMGLFAELNHAWVTIDNALYLWEYTHPNPQLVGFESQPNSINAVKLARPRPGVFLPSISHVRDISTTAEALILGLGCETSASGTKTVTLYHTGMATSISRLDISSLHHRLDCQDIFCGSADTTSNETLNPGVKIVSISPIPAAEASRYHLMAVTATGYRIYLSATGSYSWSATPTATNAPTSMQAHHVRTPPSDNPASQLPQGRGVVGPPYQVLPGAKLAIHSLDPTRSAQRFPPGYFFCFTSKNSTNRADTLFISTPDSGRLSRPQESALPIKPGETAIWLTLGSRAEDIGLCTPEFTMQPQGGFGNELAVQFDKPAAEIAVLTNTGIHVIRRRRLVDIFASLIRSDSGEEGLETQVKSLIRLYGRSETLATALAVACGQGVELSADSRLSKINDPDVLEFARKVFIEFGGKPTFNENAVADNSTPAIDAVIPSPRHAGIALYTSRLLRSIWKTVIAKQSRTPAGGVTISPSVDTSKLHSIQRDLSALQDFFRTNKSFIEGLSGPEALSRAVTKQDEIALQGEHRALHSMVQLVSDTIEGISFVLVLFDEQVHEIIALLPEETRQRFLTLTFEELFSSSKGHDVAKELVKSIVNRNIAKGSNVETVAEALRRRCGTFCSAEDVVIFKAQEQLKRATEAGGNSELGRNLLNESLILFRQVSENLSMDYLQSAVEQYIQNQFFAGAIQLCLSVAAHSDKANRALSWIMDGRPPEDPRQASYEVRQQCYDLIYKIILTVDELSGQDPGFVDGQYTVIARRKNEVYDVISNCEDEVFLTSLYDWYLDRGWSERLLEVKTPFVVTYLQRKSTEDLSHADLLWRYYGQSSRFYDAASVQLQLAQSSFSLPLSRRIEYLGQARANASVFTPNVSRASRQRLIQEISTLIDIANVQDDLLQRLKEETRIAPERKATVLQEVDGEIMELNKLYNMYADPGGYYDVCLQIMHLANYRNASDIKACWHNLIQEVHDEASAKGEPLPYEAVIEKIRGLSGRLRMSDTTFPIQILLPMLQRYVLEQQLGVGPDSWIVELFLDLQVSHELIYTVLESLFYNDEVPFHGKNRRYIGRDLLYLIARWFQESLRVGAGAFGSDIFASRVSEMLLLLQQSGLDDESVQACRDLRVKIERSL